MDSKALYLTDSVSTLPYTRCFRGSLDSQCTPLIRQSEHGSSALSRMHRARRSLQRSQLTRARFRGAGASDLSRRGGIL
jgi:hypothetical protein